MNSAIFHGNTYQYSHRKFQIIKKSIQNREKLWQGYIHCVEGCILWFVHLTQTLSTEDLQKIYSHVKIDVQSNDRSSLVRSSENSNQMPVWWQVTWSKKPSQVTNQVKSRWKVKLSDTSSGQVTNPVEWWEKLREKSCWVTSQVEWIKTRKWSDKSI